MRHKLGQACVVEKPPPPIAIMVFARRMALRYDRRIPSSAYVVPSFVNFPSPSCPWSRISGTQMIREIEGEDLDLEIPGWRERYVAFFEGHARKARGAVWAAEQDGHIIGIAAAYMPTNHRSAIVGSEQLYICNVYVVPARRRQGIGKALTLHAIEWARAKHCDVVRLRTSRMGRPLYESAGFEPSDEMELFLR